MTRLNLGPGVRSNVDPESGALRTWFSLDFQPVSKAGDSPPDIARAALADSADLFSWQPSLQDLTDRESIAGPVSTSVRFSQVFKTLPVDSSDIVVNIDNQGRLYSIYNDFHYDIPADLDPDRAHMSEEEAIRMASSVLEGAGEVEWRDRTLIVYQYKYRSSGTGKPGLEPAPRARVFANLATLHSELAPEAETRPRPRAYYIAWDFRAVTSNPRRQLASVDRRRLRCCPRSTRYGSVRLRYCSSLRSEPDRHERRHESPTHVADGHHRCPALH